jgi:SAM-dependent methyltransferase
MLERGKVRTSLEVGFPDKNEPVKFSGYRGREWRSVPLTKELPYEDAQFEVVMMDGSAVSRASVKEAHRVLRPEGHLLFSVPAKTSKQEGYTLPDIYAIVREGFNIGGLERARWWWPLLRRRRTLTIRACKKNWKSLNGTFRPYV